MAGNSDLIDIAVTLKFRTERAVRVDHGGKHPEWVPLSQCEIIDNGDGTHTLTLPEWLAKEKGMIL